METAHKFSLTNVKEEDGNVKCLSCDKNVEGVKQASFTQVRLVTPGGEQIEGGKDFGIGHVRNKSQYQNTHNTTYTHNNTNDLNYNSVEELFDMEKGEFLHTNLCNSNSTATLAKQSQLNNDYK